MFRMIKYYDSIGDGKAGLFSDCSTKYEVLELYEDAGDWLLKEYVKQKKIAVVGKVFVPGVKHYWARHIPIAFSIRLKETHTDTRWNTKEVKPVFLGLVDLSGFETGTLPPVAGADTKVTDDQAYSIVNSQEYGVSDTGETVNKGVVLVKQGWWYYHQIPLLGYSLESFESARGITEQGFDDDTSSCGECGLFDHNDDCYTTNFRIVNECHQIGVNCGCYAEYCNSDEALESYADELNAMELDACEKWQERGRLKHIARYIGGLVDGRGGYYAGEPCAEGVPKDILKALKAKHPNRRYVFSHDESGQFQTYFSVWQILPKPRKTKRAGKRKACAL